MEVLVLNVTNWIGYHMTEHLLQEGYQVKGVKAVEGSEHLGDFFTRNSNFEWMGENLEGAFPLGICVLDPPDIENCEFEHLFLINGSATQIANTTVIHAPYLFGEWMPLDKEGLHQQFIKKGIYIEDFLDAFTPLLEKPPSTNEIYLHPARKIGDKILEKYVPVHENSPREEKIKQVLLHYEQFQELYPEMK